jgi:hypothetical protein
MLTSAEEFMRLRSSRIKTEYDRSALEEAPIEVWYEVVNEYPDYREWVIHNKTVPLEILEYLYELDSSMRRSIARKRKLSEELFERLSVDQDESVRFAITVNKKTPLRILETLTRDKAKDVARRAKKSIADRIKPVAPADNSSSSHKSFQKTGTCPVCNGDIMRASVGRVSEVCE